VKAGLKLIEQSSLEVYVDERTVVELKKAWGYLEFAQKELLVDVAMSQSTESF